MLPSLSRLMNLGIGGGRTREDHRAVADQLYAFYARGRDVRRMAAIVGEAGLGDQERAFMDFAARFEAEFIQQGEKRRSIEETLATGWRLLDVFSPEALTRIGRTLIERYRPEGGGDGAGTADADGVARDAGAAAGRTARGGAAEEQT